MYKCILSIICIIILLIPLLVFLEFSVFTSTNFHKLFHPHLYTNIDDIYTENTEFRDRVIIGKNIAKNSKIVICGLARNNENVIVNTLNRLRKTAQMFNEYKIVIFENDSEDNTRNIIKKECSKDKNIILLDCCEVDCDCKLGQKKMYDLGMLSGKRIEKMAFFRNRYLKYVQKNLSGYDYMLVMDMDLTQNGEYSDAGILHSLSFDFDAIAINGRCSLAGTFGLITEAYDSLAYKSKYRPYGMRVNSVNMNKDIADALENDFYDDRTSLIPVISAFNGMALYRIPSISGASYDSKNNNEHLDFHESIIRNGRDKIYLNPYFLGYFSIQGPRHDILSVSRNKRKV